MRAVVLHAVDSRAEAHDSGAGRKSAAGREAALLCTV